MQVNKKNFSQSCENNKKPIFSIIESLLKNVSQVVEIGSGTGQHATFFSERLPHLTWQTTDQGEYLAPLKVSIGKLNLSSLPTPLLLDVSQAIWPVSDCGCIFTANTLHIMSLECVEKFFNGIQRSLRSTGQLFIYGPFNYQGRYTSDSNQAFDQRLKRNNSLSGIRDIEKIICLAKQAQLELSADHSMPANNRLLHFVKK